MESDDRYIKASRYDLKAQAHNRRVFHCELVARPWRALACAIGMSIVGVNAVLGQVDAPRCSPMEWHSLDGLALCRFCLALCGLLSGLCCAGLEDTIPEFEQRKIGKMK